MSKSVLVVGASGTVGTNVVNGLKSLGQSVRASTSGEPKSADQVRLDLSSGAGRDTAFDGVNRLFLLSPAGFTNQDELLLPLIERAKQRGLAKVVLMTAWGANASDELPLRKVELALERSGLRYDILRPNWFMQNFNSYWIGGIREQGKILLPAADATVSFIDARDIADVAVKLLTTDAFDNLAFELSGAESLTHAEVAKRLGAVIGKPIGYENITPEALKQSLLGAGVGEPYADFLNLILGYLRQGYNAAVNDNVERITGRAPRTLQTYLEDYKSAWL
ncbi:MAG: NmrA family NAD(P)-binding protein [Polyangiaceae bacterium]